MGDSAATPPGDYRQRLYARYLSDLHAGGGAQHLPDLAPRRAHLQRLVRDFFPADRGARGLELGCGHGALLAIAREAGYTGLRGVDASPEQVEIASRLGIGGVTWGDLTESLAVQPEASLHLIVAFDVLEHFRKDELLDLVDDIARVLAPGGRLIAHVPNAESPFGARIRYGDLTHELAFTAGSATQLCRACGFRRITCHEDAPAAHGLRSAGRLVVWRTLRTLLQFCMAAETGSGRALFTQNIFVVADK